MTYRDLDDGAEALAVELAEASVSSRSLVAVCLERSAAMLVAMLAVLKAGAAFVPLDPDQPPERLGFILDDTRARLLLTDTEVLAKLRSGDARIDVPILDVACGRGMAPPPRRRPVVADPQSLAYVIYTSGSTGRPKGVAVPHHAAARHFRDIAAMWELAPSDRMLHSWSVGWDGAFDEIFPPLLSGAALVVRGREMWGWPQLLRAVRSARITTLLLPTAYWTALASAAPRGRGTGSPVRLVSVGGEAMTPEALSLWRRGPLGAARLLNVYGPTEAVVVSHAFEVPTVQPPDGYGASVPIGWPIAARPTRIVGEYGEDVASGVLGELWIGGDCLARGYVGDPESTARRFVVVDSEGGSQRFYRSGDLVRELPDGGLQFAGRLDDQVKIRGFRIEPGEVESVLRRIDSSVRQAVAIVVDHGVTKRLVAFLVLDEASRATFDARRLRALLHDHLPDYMVPSDIVALGSLPVTSTGKTDRRRLLELARELLRPQRAGSVDDART